jgi:uncharacterized membrane protein YhaH (DUF805 family)
MLDERRGLVLDSAGQWRAIVAENRARGQRMRGIILAVAPDGTYGQLSAEDGQRYSYWTSEIRNGRGQVGQGVDFQLWEGQPIDIFVLADPAPSRGAPPQRPGAPQPAGYGAAAPAYAAVSSPYAAAAAAIPPLDYWITLFTSPAGRISRRQFWLHGVLPIIVCSLVLGWIPVLGALVTLALTWASICICFKRFHDLGYPGWWSLLNIVPMLLAAFLTGASFFMTGFGFAWLLAEVLWGLALVVWVVQMALVYLHVGQPGPNEYGPDPLGGA